MLITKILLRLHLYQPGFGALELKLQLFPDYIARLLAPRQR